MPDSLPAGISAGNLLKASSYFVTRQASEEETGQSNLTQQNTNTSTVEYLHIFGIKIIIHYV